MFKYIICAQSVSENSEPLYLVEFVDPTGKNPLGCKWGRIEEAHSFSLSPACMIIKELYEIQEEIRLVKLKKELTPEAIMEYFVRPVVNHGVQ